LEDKITSKGI